MGIIEEILGRNSISEFCTSNEAQNFSYGNAMVIAWTHQTMAQNKTTNSVVLSPRANYTD
jgi:hypothetical protein